MAIIAVRSIRLLLGAIAMIAIGGAVADGKVDCRRIVFHPYCRGISAKRANLINQEEESKSDEQNSQSLPNLNNPTHRGGDSSSGGTLSTIESSAIGADESAYPWPSIVSGNRNPSHPLLPPPLPFLSSPSSSSSSSSPSSSSSSRSFPGKDYVNLNNADNPNQIIANYLNRKHLSSNINHPHHHHHHHHRHHYNHRIRTFSDFDFAPPPPTSPPLSLISFPERSFNFDRETLEWPHVAQTNRPLYNEEDHLDYGDDRPILPSISTDYYHHRYRRIDRNSRAMSVIARNGRRYRPQADDNESSLYYYPMSIDLKNDVDLQPRQQSRQIQWIIVPILRSQSSEPISKRLNRVPRSVQ